MESNQGSLSAADLQSAGGSQTTIPPDAPATTRTSVSGLSVQRLGQLSYKGSQKKSPGVNPRGIPCLMQRNLRIYPRYSPLHPFGRYDRDATTRRDEENITLLVALVKPCGARRQNGILAVLALAGNGDWLALGFAAGDLHR